MKNTAKSHKKFWVIGIASVLIGLWAVGCTNGEKSQVTENVPQSEAQQSEAAPVQETSAPAETPATEDTAAGAIDDYEVAVLDAVTTKDYEGKPAMVISFDFKNNSSSTASFFSAVSCIAYQDGVSLDSAVISDDTVCDSSASLKSLQPGAQLKVQEAYVLSNTTSPVTVEVKPLIDFSGKQKLTKTFTF